jgi:hypothetical protein
MSEAKRSWKVVLAAACLALCLGPAALAQDADAKQKERADKERAVEQLRAQIEREEVEKQRTIEKLRAELKKDAETRDQKLAEFEKREEALRQALEMERQRLGEKAKREAVDKARADLDTARLDVDSAKLRDTYRRTLVLKDANAGVRVPLKMEKGAFLGVSTSPVGAAMREQLRLPRGVGLVVEHVEKGSPAEQAGVRQYDILQKLNDQLLINSHQLSVLVRTFKPGETVRLAVVREGKPQEVKATLAEKDLPPVGEHDPMGAFPGRPLNVIIGDDGAMAGEVLKLPADRVQGMAAFSRAGNKTVVANVRDDLTLMLDRRGNSLSLRAFEPRSKRVLFEGPIDTDEQRKAIPKKIAEEMETETFRKIFRDMEQDREMRLFVEPGGAANDVVIEFDAQPVEVRQAEVRLVEPPAAGEPQAPAPAPRQ